ALTNLSEPVDQYVCSAATRPCGSAARLRVTAARKAGSATVIVGLRYSTTTSASSLPNALTARLLARWLWLFGGVKPPEDCSEPNTPVPQAAAAASAISAIPSASTRRR